MGFIVGYIRIMENKMETTVIHWGYIGNNGKENGNYYLGFRVSGTERDHSVDKLPNCSALKACKACSSESGWFRV